MEHADFLIIGGGIAGLSAAVRLARHGRVLVLEGEEAVGYHSSGRSVSFSHYGIGTAPVRALTAYSRATFAPPLGRLFPTLYFADEAALPRLEALSSGPSRRKLRRSWVERDISDIHDRSRHEVLRYSRVPK